MQALTYLEAGRLVHPTAQRVWQGCVGEGREVGVKARAASGQDKGRAWNLDWALPCICKSR